MKEAGPDRFPRGAIVVVALGLLATALVAWVSDRNLISSKPLPWLENHPEAVGTSSAGFGAGGSITLSGTGFDVTGTNSAGYRLFQVGGEIDFDPGRTTGAVTITCRAVTEPPTVNARTPNRPAGFPGPIENLEEATWPGDVTVNYSDQGRPFSTVTLPTAYMGYGGEAGISVEWGDWEAGTHTWIWNLAADRERPQARLRFVSLWRTFATPAIEIDCRAESERGPTAAVATGGSLPG